MPNCKNFLMLSTTSEGIQRIALKRGANLDAIVAANKLAKWDAFTKSQSGGIVPHTSNISSRVESDCRDTILTPQVLQMFLWQQYKALQHLLFMQGQVPLSGCAAVLLPASLSTSASNSLPLLSHHQLHQVDLLLHFLCYVRGDAAELLVLPPSYQLTDNAATYWQVHLVNGPGLALPVREWNSAATLLMAWHAVLGLGGEMKLPEHYHHLFTNIPAMTTQQLGRWLTHYMLHSALVYMASLPNPLRIVEEVQVTINGTAPNKLRQILASSNMTELQPVAPLFDPEQQVYLCIGHAQSLASLQMVTDHQADPWQLVSPQQFSIYTVFIGSLQVNDAGLIELPDEMFENLPNLIHLDLSSNKIKWLPDNIRLCTKLLYLSIPDNQLTDLPSGLSQLSICLKRLDISHNSLSAIPSVVFDLKNLRKLYAQCLMLTELPPEVGQLTLLELLDVKGHYGITLPASIQQLHKLEYLNLSGVPWVIVKSLGHALTWAEFKVFIKSNNLHQWRNQSHKLVLEDLFLPGSFGSLQDSSSIHDADLAALCVRLYQLTPRLGTNKCPVPSHIWHLPNLKNLNLQYQGLHHIPSGVRGLTNLQELVLSNNPFLETLPAELGSLPLKRLEINFCPSLRTPPMEITSQGFGATFAYLRRLQSGEVTCRRTKLMLVGLGGAGKTSLVMALLSAEGCANNSNVPTVTDGIDISQWTMGQKQEMVTFSVWDFAGQTVYYNTHQFFLSNRAVYLLLWNVRLGHEHAGLNFWLGSISVHAPKAAIFIVGTHCDEVARSELPMRQLKEDFPQIVGFHLISSITGQGVSELKAAIHSTTLAQPYMGERIPAVWLALEDAITKQRAETSLIEYSTLQELAIRCGIFEPTDMTQCVRFLHDLGSLQHFENQALKHKVVINPQWVVDVMACIISVKNSVIVDGRLRHSDIRVVWQDYPTDLYPWLLRLTEEYDLTFPLPDEPVNLVPCLLPETPPEHFEWPKNDSNIRELKMIYKFAYLPAGLFNRSQVRLYQYSDVSHIWKHGSILQKNGHLALIAQTKSSELVVKVQGPRPENILFLIHEVFEGLIHEAFQGVTYDFYLPCVDCLSQGSKDPFMFAASTVRRAQDTKVPFLQCMANFHILMLQDLLNIMPPDSTQDYESHLISDVNGLESLHQNLQSDVFVSVSLSDPSDTISRVCRDLDQHGFSCVVPDRSSENNDMEKLAISLRRCRLILAFISKQYVHDQYCSSMLQFAVEVLHKPLVIATLDSDGWQQSDLGLILADTVWINFSDPQRYHHKIQELLEMVKDKGADREQESAALSTCFISYCWSNSQRAVDKGSRRVESAMGCTDPRAIKDFLHQQGIECWIDVERVGKMGLFEDIAAGLRKAKLMIACVSDEYVASKNCVMEFRFATSVLKIPTILVVVGTGNRWRKSEVGMRTLQMPLPEINFQFDSSANCYLLLQHVMMMMPSVKAKVDDKPLVHQAKEEEKLDKSYKELYELAQRKLLRQLSQFADKDTLLYPKLVILDFLLESKKEMTTARLKHRPSFVEKNQFLRQNKLCFRILCEDEQGWHEYGQPFMAPTELDEGCIARLSPYLARMTALLRHNEKMQLQCTQGEEGEAYLRWLQQLPQAQVSDFSASYLELRQLAAQCDTQQTKGQLQRCHLVSGKVLWLCPEHQQMPRVTVLSASAALNRTVQPLDTTDWGRILVHEISEPLATAQATEDICDYEPCVVYGNSLEEENAITQAIQASHIVQGQASQASHIVQGQAAHGSHSVEEYATQAEVDRHKTASAINNIQDTPAPRQPLHKNFDRLSSAPRLDRQKTKSQIQAVLTSQTAVQSELCRIL